MTLQECEQIQEDIITYLDGQDEKLIDRLCNVVVEYYKQQ